MVWTASAYAVGAIVLLALGKGSYNTGPDVGWALVSAVIVVSSWSSSTSPSATAKRPR